uniref:Uncharacterized protein n=1 Tax=Hyaloperonospora arabidopsidis (strain Emoy2) TaxID=559515 RepID=M4BMH8_HYAAE
MVLVLTWNPSMSFEYCGIVKVSLRPLQISKSDQSGFETNYTSMLVRFNRPYAGYQPHESPLCNGVPPLHDTLHKVNILSMNLC